MDLKALHTISYGLYIVASRNGDAINGQIANAVIQVSGEPVSVAVCINKRNLTNEYIKKSKMFSVSVLDAETPLSVIQRFGFKSGREIDKFQGISFNKGKSGLPYLTDHVLSYLEADVVQEVDAGTHDVFIGKVTDAGLFKNSPPLTYAHYRFIKKGGIPEAAPVFEKKEMGGNAQLDKYVCSVCGYIYDPEDGDPEGGIPPRTPFDELPDDWVCPVCGAGKEKFEREER